jgi:glycosyltransferase involved in cell wall biosynthesis
MASLFLKGAAERGGGGIPPQLRGIVGDLVSHPMPEAPRAGGGPVDPMGAEVMRRLRSDRRLVRTYRRLGRAPDGAERSHARLRLVTGWAHTQLTDMALGPMGTIAGRSALGSLSDRLGWMLGAAAMVAPYLLAAGYHAREERFAAEMSEEFFGASLTDRGPVRVAMLTDTFDELNGVAGTLRRLAAHSARTDSGITVITCRERAGEGPGVAAVRPLAWMPVPAYADPSWRLGVPPLLDLLEVLQRRRVEVVHAATPGPMGLAGLLLARILGLPFVCSYHTELARYALTLTGDRVAAEIVRAGLGWFHGQAERVYAPSRATASGLVAEGVDPHKLVLFSRGVDTDLFRPERRTRSMRRRLGGPDATIVLSVGRISKEKGLLRLAEAMRRLSVTRPGLTLALVGDGPAREEVAAALAGVPHRFVGPLRGEELAAAYASADLFCLPSETETLGQVVLEAGASGLPVVVSDAGAACESVRDGSTGLVARAGDPDDLARRLAELVDDPLTRGAMGASARALMVSRPSWDRIFEGLAEGYQDLRGPRPAPPAASDAPFGAPAA